jgi:hypothetical protein
MSETIPTSSTPPPEPASDWSSLLYSTDWFGIMKSAVEESSDRNISTCELTPFMCPNLENQFQVAEIKFLKISSYYHFNWY